ncbi:MAG: tRNA pseudouridine(55) synthase TruB [Prevotella sp.]|nr:tRNA pseudouridine(55) synthase TruB [Prevotella sp.]
MNFYLGEIIGIDKPYGISSFKALAHVRYHISRRIGGKIKTGHAGTLDPLATGVLVICTGKATKRIEELQQHTKEYLATLQLGATTASFDLEHPVDMTYPTEHITLPLIEKTLRGFIGQIEQIPPIYSACKINGKRAYKMARKGKEVELKAKTLIINEIELLGFDAEEKRMDIRVVCSKGTYIRALARDIGRALESGAYLTSLRRTRVGDIKVENCISLKDFPVWLEKQSIETEIES